MIVVVSDLHFQDTATSGPSQHATANVTAAAFEQLWRQIDVLAERAGAADAITVVLNGDIIELLRSERWLDEGSRPYNFVGALDAAALQTASNIGAAVLRENAPALAALRGRHDVNFVFVYGNHDRLLRHEALSGVRARFAELLGADVRFVDSYRDERHRLVVQHGHELDWTCSEYQHARIFEGRDARNPALRMHAPLGDWVALDIGTRLPYLAWQMLASDDKRWSELPPPLRQDLYARLVHLDDLRPPGEVLRWLTRSGQLADLTARTSETTAIARFLGDLMNELVTAAMPRIDPWLEVHGRPLFDRLALAAVGLLGSTKYTAATLPAVMEKIHAYLAGQDKPWAVLQRTDEWHDAECAYFTSGHTHDPVALPLRSASPFAANVRRDAAAWYVNTGTWRKTIVRSPIDPDVYGAIKQVAFAVFYDAEETYRATGELSVTFDLWQGSSQRF